MKRRTASSAVGLIGLSLLGLLAGHADLFAQTAAPQLRGAGWTGLTHPEDIIAARVDLMHEVEQLMIPIDTFAVDDSLDLEALRKNAATVSHLLRALPHLFPPSTNLYDAEATVTPTLARPELWESFDAFYALAMSGVAQAEAVSKTKDAATFRETAADLRAICSACHDAFLPAYEPAKLDPSDFSDANLGAFE